MTTSDCVPPGSFRGHESVASERNGKVAVCVIAGLSQTLCDLTLCLLRAEERIERANDVNVLLTDEARLTKELFKLAAQTMDYGEFKRAKRGSGTDPANGLLDHGNYLAYGLGAAATWVLGLPHGLAVLHGKTRRGGLVFDAADLVKDAMVLPQAFLSATAGHEKQEFRQILHWYAD